jgi:hypothetical protein
VGEKGERFFPCVRKESFSAQRLSEPFDPRQKIAEAHRTYILHGHIQSACFYPEFRFE